MYLKCAHVSVNAAGGDKTKKAVTSNLNSSSNQPLYNCRQRTCCECYFCRRCCWIFRKAHSFPVTFCERGSLPSLWPLAFVFITLTASFFYFNPALVKDRINRAVFLIVPTSELFPFLCEVRRLIFSDSELTSDVLVTFSLRLLIGLYFLCVVPFISVQLYDTHIRFHCGKEIIAKRTEGREKSEKFNYLRHFKNCFKCFLIPIVKWGPAIIGRHL